MSEHLSSATAQPQDAATQLRNERDALRLLSRSPHPYHHQKSELLEPSGIISSSTTARSALQPDQDSYHIRSRTSYPAASRDTTPTSDSGTEADDEHFLKGLPAPRTKLHKGLRGRNELLSGTSSPFPSPAYLEDETRRTSYITSGLKQDSKPDKERQIKAESSKRNKVIIRRITEVLLLGSLGVVVYTNSQVRPVVYKWRLGK